MNNELRIKKIIVILILLLAAFLRLYRLGDYPALNADEAAIGYNAYSLLETGHDEHGNSWPIHFQSFNDYKPGAYFYLVLPFIKFFGLNEWAVRIPGALIGIATVYVVYLLVNEIFAKQKKQLFVANPRMLALTASFFLAISPWHIHFSRGGWEVNLSTFFITIGVLLFLRSVRKVFCIKYLVLSILFFILSLYTYHAARIIAPLLVFGLSMIHRNQIKQNLKRFVIAGLIGTILLIPLGLDLMKGTVFSRAAGVGLFADTGTIERINEQRYEHQGTIWTNSRILHNKLVNYGLLFLNNWTKHYHGEFLFLSGDDIQRNKVPEMGQMYLFDIIFILAGLVAIAKKFGAWKAVLLWLIVAPVAAALTFQSPHALRAQNMVIPLVIISGYGLISLSSYLHKIFPDKKLLSLIFTIFILAISWNFSQYLLAYWQHMPKKYPFSSQYGVKELVEYVEVVGDNYERIVVTDRYDQPYILFLFYLKYPPERFQANHELSVADEYGFSTVRKFDKFEFRSIDFENEKQDNPNGLIIGTDAEIPNETHVVKEIYGTNGYKYFQIVAN